MWRSSTSADGTKLTELTAASAVSFRFKTPDGGILILPISDLLFESCNNVVASWLDDPKNKFHEGKMKVEQFASKFDHPSFRKVSVRDRIMRESPFGDLGREGKWNRLKLGKFSSPRPSFPFLQQAWSS